MARQKFDHQESNNSSFKSASNLFFVHFLLILKPPKEKKYLAVEYESKAIG